MFRCLSADSVDALRCDLLFIIGIRLPLLRGRHGGRNCCWKAGVQVTESESKEGKIVEFVRQQKGADDQ